MKDVFTIPNTLEKGSHEHVAVKAKFDDYFFKDLAIIGCTYSFIIRLLNTFALAFEDATLGLNNRRKERRLSNFLDLTDDGIKEDIDAFDFIKSIEQNDKRTQRKQSNFLDMSDDEIEKLRWNCFSAKLISNIGGHHDN